MNHTPYSVEYRVYWSDTDAAGIAHFTSILKMVEKAEEDLYRSIGIQSVHTTLPRIEVHVRYRAPLRWGDLAKIELKLEEARRRGLRYGFKIYNVSINKLAAEGYIAVACVKKSEGSIAPTECPEELFEAWKRYG